LSPCCTYPRTSQDSSRSSSTSVPTSMPEGLPRGERAGEPHSLPERGMPPPTRGPRSTRTTNVPLPSPMTEWIGNLRGSARQSSARTRSLWERERSGSTRNARRMKEKRCLRCGRDGCWISECPLLPAKRPRPPARVKKSRPRLPEVEDLVDMDDDSSAQTETDEEELKE